MWFGLGNQVAYSFAQTEEMAPFRDLLQRNRQFFWNNNVDTLLERAQVKIVEERVKRLEMEKPTCLATYLCITGLEFLLLQQDSVRRQDCRPGHWCWQSPGS